MYSEARILRPLTYVQCGRASWAVSKRVHEPPRSARLTDVSTSVEDIRCTREEASSAQPPLGSSRAGTQTTEILSTWYTSRRRGVPPFDGVSSLARPSRRCISSHVVRSLYAGIRHCRSGSLRLFLHRPNTQLHGGRSILEPSAWSGTRTRCTLMRVVTRNPCTASYHH